MMHTEHSHLPALLTEEEVTTLLQLGHRTLEGWRHRRTSPPFFHAGKHVRYRLDLVLAWVESNGRGGRGQTGSTASDGGVGPVPLIPVFLTTKELAAYLGVPAKTINYWRSRGDGPRWTKNNNAVRYRTDHVLEWLDAVTVRQSQTPAA